MSAPNVHEVVASTRRLSALSHSVQTANEVHDALADELLRLLDVEEVHLQHLTESGQPRLAVAYTRTPELRRRSYSVPETSEDSGVQWVAATRRPLVAPHASPLPAALVGSERVAAAALLPLSVDSVVSTVVILVSGAQALADEQLEVAGMLVELASTTIALLGARAAARTDALTGLMNHGAMVSRLNEEIDRARRQGTALACLLIDLDNFKQINDYYGHLMGDGVLRHVADTLRSEFRRFDRVARYGGDEFVVLLPGSSAARAEPAAGRALEHLREIRIESDGHRYSLTASMGLATWEESDTPQSLLDRADIALRESKREGKDRLAMPEGREIGRGSPAT